MKLKAGWGVTIGYDFYRLPEDTPFEHAPDKPCRKGDIMGWIPGRPDHPRGFMRANRVLVIADRRSLITE